MPRQRGNGEGTIRERPDGLWEARVTVGHSGGKPVRKSLYGHTRQEVADLLNAALDSLRRGLPLQTNERTTIEDYLAAWLRDTVKPRVRPRTFELYELLIRRHINPHIGHIRLTRLTPQHVQQLYKKLGEQAHAPQNTSKRQPLDGILREEKKLSPRTIRSVRTVLRQALAEAQTWGLVHRNVAALVRLPAASSTTLAPYDLDEARAFLEAVKGHRLEALFVVAMFTGMRRGELLALQWADVDLDRGWAKVTGSLQRVNRKLERTEPKTEQSRRTVALPTQAVTALNEHCIRQIEERLKCGPHWQNSGYVFTTTVGTPIEGRNLNRQFDAILENAKLRKVRFHDLRHCYATLQLASGTPARVVMEALGHSRIDTTLDVYTSVLEPVSREAADKLGAMFGEALSGYA